MAPDDQSFFRLKEIGFIFQQFNLLPRLAAWQNVALPLIYSEGKFDFEKAKQGIYQMIWGLVKKVVIADTCATYANAIFDNYESMNSLSLLLGAVYFAFQIMLNKQIRNTGVGIVVKLVR